LRSALGSALVATKGQGASEVRKTYDETRELAQRIGEAPQPFPVLFGLGAYYTQQEEMKITNDLAEECLALAEQQHEPLLIVAAVRLLMMVSFWSGNPQLAHEYCERVLRVPYDPFKHRSLALASGFDPLTAICGRMRPDSHKAQPSAGWRVGEWRQTPVLRRRRSRLRCGAGGSARGS
jgi:hypothetical protein